MSTWFGPGSGVSICLTSHRLFAAGTIAALIGSIQSLFLGSSSTTFRKLFLTLQLCASSSAKGGSRLPNIFAQDRDRWSKNQCDKKKSLSSLYQLFTAMNDPRTPDPEADVPLSDDENVLLTDMLRTGLRVAIFSARMRHAEQDRARREARNVEYCCRSSNRFRRGTTTSKTCKSANLETGIRKSGLPASAARGQVSATVQRCRIAVSPPD